MAYSLEHKKLGLCTRCSMKAVEGRVKCKKHLERHRIEQSIRDRTNHPKKRALGICYDCENPAIPGLMRCVVHILASRKTKIAYRKKMMKMGRCRSCWAPLELGEMDKGHTKCIFCREETQWKSSIKFSGKTMTLS